MLQYLDRAIDRVTHIMLLLAGVVLVLLVVLMNVEVASRYLFNTSTLISDEYGGYALVWICLLGFSQALRAGQFLSVDAVIDMLPSVGKRLSLMLGALVGVGVAAVLAYMTFKLAYSNLKFGAVSIQPSATPLWMPQLILPIGFGWLCIIYLQLFVKVVWPRVLDGSDRS
jgi:TRAP-type C4-dicarboxylate transport system permease small subunit